MRDVMTKKVMTIGLEQPLTKAYEMMQSKGIRHLPVMTGSKLVGILSDRDIRFALSFYERLERPTGSLKVDDAFIDDPFIATTSDDLKKVAAEMADRRIGSALVMEGDKLAGIFTATDACRTLAELIKDIEG